MALVSSPLHPGFLARYLPTLFQRLCGPGPGCRARRRSVKPRHSRALIFFLLLAGSLPAETKRVVIVKLDGVPHDLLERELRHIDLATGKSNLPWIDHIFAQRGTRVENFYVRAISLSAPSWSLLDTGRHLQIHGNAEFDRYTYHVYDYMNFFPFYVGC